MRSVLVGVLLVGAAWLLGCTQQPSADQRALVLDAVPSDLPLRLDTDFDGRVQLVGARVTPTRDLKPGSRVELTLYWRKVSEVPKGVRLFTHVLDEAGERVLNLDGTGPLRKTAGGKPVLPPSAWEIGTIYVDQQTFSVPQSLRSDGITIAAGLFAGDERLAVRRGKHESNRAIVTELSVSRPAKAASSLPPVLWVPRRKKGAPLVIDGKLDEESWSRAATTGQLVNAGTGELQHGSAVTGNVRVLYDDEALYVAFEVFDEDVRGGFDPAVPDPQLWTRDTVELMIDPDGDGDNKDYYEIQVGPQNLVFDSRFDGYNLPRVEPHGPFGHQDWSSNLQSAVEVHGTLDDAREDDGYTVEMAIPWRSFAKAKRVPPTSADSWRMNFYVIQNNGGAAWSPILGQGNFHRASRFGRVHFIGAPPRFAH